jgi:tape measure domain-containing protein
MVATVGSIAIDLSTNVAKFASGFKSAATTVDRESGRMARSIKSVDTATAAMVRNSIAGLAAGLGTREITRYADAWTEAGNKIRAASEIAERQGRSTEQLNDIATRTRTGLIETVDLYAKLLRSTANVAKSEEEVARATEIVNKAFKAGGAAASEQAAGILQLGQALSSGLFQGDELRSIRENAPILAQAIADEYGVTIGALKELGANGELTAERVFQAILKGQDKIDAAFNQTKATLGENLTLLKNASIELIGVLDGLTGASGGLAAGMSSLAAEIRAAGQAAEEFASSGSLDDFLKIFGLSLGEGGRTDAARDFFNGIIERSNRTAEEVKADIAEIEQRIEDLKANQAAGFFEENTIARDLEELKALQDELKKVEIAALSAANNGNNALANLAKSAIAAMDAAVAEQPLPTVHRGADGNSSGVRTNVNGVGVTKYERDTAENTERTADTLEDQSTAYKGYFENLEETLKNDVTGGITKYIQQLIYAQELATQSISEAVQAGIGIASRDSSGGSTASWAGRQFKVKVGGDIQQTIYDPRVHGSPEEFANRNLSTGGLKINYAGMFAEGGSFIAPGNQTGDTTRLLMDVNGGERVTVSPAGDSGKSITLNFYAAQGENEATMRQRARKAGEEIGRQLARA